MKPLPSREKTVYHTLDPETYNDARIVAPGYDVYNLEREWRTFWFESGKPELKNPDAAFIGFCKSRYSRKPKSLESTNVVMCVSPLPPAHKGTKAQRRVFTISQTHEVTKVANHNSTYVGFVPQMW